MEMDKNIIHERVHSDLPIEKLSINFTISYTKIVRVTLFYHSLLQTQERCTHIVNAFTIFTSE